MGTYRFAPALTVDETAVDRPLYKLIYLTRHAAGIRVFRDAHRRALEAQSTYRSAKKADARRRTTGMDDMFSPITAMEPGERSAREIADGEIEARRTLLRFVGGKAEGLDWRDLWPDVLDACVITYAGLGDIARELWSSGQVLVPAWQSRAIKRPKDEFRFHLPAEM